MRCDTTIGEWPIGTDQVDAWIGLPYWVLIGGIREGHVQEGSVNVEQNGDGVTRARCSVVNPQSTIAEGKTFSVIWRGATIFAGLLKTVTIITDQAESAFIYHVEADGWDSLLARHLITKTYTNVMAGQILRDAIVQSGVSLDGVSAGIVDDGIQILLADSDHVRVSDFVRDIGVAGGGIAFIDPYKQIQFRPSSVDVSSVQVVNARCETIQQMTDVDNYRNRQVVKVTGLNGTTTVTETRNDLAQQAIRIADEGGSGIYEDYISIKHPTSSVSGELSIMGQTYGYLTLRTYARNARRVTVTMRDPAPEIGQLVTVTLPGFSLSGTFIVMRKMWREVGGQFLFEVELWESSFQKLALESLLRIVGAGKASVSISANVFPNAQIFSTPGSGFTWTVPGGVTAAQFTTYGAGGGGSGAHGYQDFPGSIGGAGGKAVTIISVLAGQVYDIVVGTGGAAGVSISGISASPSTAGSNGTATYVSISAGPHLAQGDGGGGAPSSYTPPYNVPPLPGVNGGGFGDAVVVGGGSLGGAGGVDNASYPSTDYSATQPFDGNAGVFEVRW